MVLAKSLSRWTFGMLDSMYCVKCDVEFLLSSRFESPKFPTNVLTGT